MSRVDTLTARRGAALVALVAATLSVVPSCQSEDCLDMRSSIPVAGFYSCYDKETVTLDSLDVSGVDVPGDSLLLKVGEDASGVYMPVRSAVPSTSFCIHYGYRQYADEKYNDTITLRYTSIPYFVSQECGAMYRYRIDGISHTRHLIDSVGCSDSLITNVETERLSIYFRVERGASSDDAPPAKGGEL